MNMNRYFLAFVLSTIIAGAANAQVALTYDPMDGNVQIDSRDRSITTIEVISDSGMFIPANANDVFPFPSLITEQKFFKLGAGAAAFQFVDFGNILPPGLSQAELDADFGVSGGNGSVAGSLTPVDGVEDNGIWAQNPDPSTHRLCIGGIGGCIPEPGSMSLIILGSLGLLRLRPKSRRLGRPR